MKTLTVLGSTGSIGTNTLDVVRRNRHQYQVYALAAGRNIEPWHPKSWNFGPASQLSQPPTVWLVYRNG